MSRRYLPSWAIIRRLRYSADRRFIHYLLYAYRHPPTGRCPVCLSVSSPCFSNTVSFASLSYTSPLLRPWQSSVMSSTPGPSGTSQPPRSLDRQVVLDEDEYTEALSHIIARDFFPSLVHLDATNDYLDALRAQDTERIDATVRRLESLTTPGPNSSRVWQTPSRTPYATGPSDTPLRTPRGEPPEKRARYDTDLSLDDFQARYTSEDNSSFTQILDEENRRRREKWAWAWDAQRRVQDQRGKMLEGRERLLIEAPGGAGVREKFLIEAPTPAGLITSGSDGESGRGNGDKAATEGDGTDNEEGSKEVVLSKRPEAEEAVDVMAPKKDTRPAGVDGWEFKVCCCISRTCDAC